MDEIARINTILGNPKLTEEDYRWAQEVIIETGAVEYSRQLARSLITEAKGVLLGSVEIKDESRNYLLGIADFMLEREY